MNIGWLILGFVLLSPFVIGAVVALVRSEFARLFALTYLGLLVLSAILVGGVISILVGFGIPVE